MKKLERFRGARVLGITQGRGWRLEAEFGWDRRWPGSGGVECGMGDAVGIERSWQRCIEHGESLAISRRQSEAKPSRVVVARRTVVGAWVGIRCIDGRDATVEAWLTAQTRLSFIVSVPWQIGAVEG